MKTACKAVQKPWWKATPQTARRFAGWTPAMVDELRRLWSVGLSASACAAALSDAAAGRVVTRNAVIGQISRLGLKRNEAAVRAVRDAALVDARRARRSKYEDAAQARGRARAEESARRKALAPDDAAYLDAMTRGGAFAAAAARAPVSLVAAGPDACRWPCGETGEDFRFCGAPRANDRVYCAAHAALAYRLPEPPPQKRRRR